MAGDFSETVGNAAEVFIGQVHEATGMAAIVCDSEGIIRKAHDRSRIGKPHSGAQAILRENRTEYVVTADEVRRNPLVKLGCSVAIVVDGRKAGTFGITGVPEIATPVARISSLLLGSFIRQSQQQVLLHETSGRIFQEVEGLMARSRSSAAQLREIYESMSRVAEEASGRAAASNGILKTVSRIAGQSHILSLNGSVEAARAGAVGRAFSVVVDEMAQLSKDTSTAVSSVQVAVDEIREAIRSVGAAIRESSSVSHESVGIMEEIPPMMGQLKDTIARLEAAFRS